MLSLISNFIGYKKLALVFKKYNLCISWATGYCSKGSRKPDGSIWVSLSHMVLLTATRENVHTDGLGCGPLHPYLWRCVTTDRPTPDFKNLWSAPASLGGPEGDPGVRRTQQWTVPLLGHKTVYSNSPLWAGRKTTGLTDTMSNGVLVY